MDNIYCRIGGFIIKINLQYHYDQHSWNDTNITIRWIQFGHIQRKFFIGVGINIREIHTIYSHYESEWNKDGWNNSQHFHYFVKPVAYTRQINIHQTCCDLPVRINHIHNLNSMIISITKETFWPFCDQRIICSDYLI